MRELLAARNRGDGRAALAVEMFCYRVKKQIGAYLAALGGADAVVFAGGIGERAFEVRAEICSGMQWCGLVLDPERNAGAVGEETRISADDSSVAAYVIPVDEAAIIARDTVDCLLREGYTVEPAAAEQNNPTASSGGCRSCVEAMSERFARRSSPPSTARTTRRRRPGRRATDQSSTRWRPRPACSGWRTCSRPGGARGRATLFEVLHAADRAACAAMWLVVHETYARNVYLDGRDLGPEDFKTKPEGHTGGALNMVPAYIGYMAVNAITGLTRSWVMGQGHTVAAIDSVNLLLGNMTEAHAERYSVTDEGLTRYVRDFYSYRLTSDGTQDSPLGSHVNAHTAGGLVEGGYLGFTELQYVHMPLPGERLVVFLSDGAFEEQRGSDWAPRWWRSEDSGLVAPIMIANGRRIDQRTTMSQEGVAWFTEHLELNSFDPIAFDGRDPAAFAWAIFEMEERLEGSRRSRRGDRYPVLLPHGVAVAPKGAGFYGEGTNLALTSPSPETPARTSPRPTTSTTAPGGCGYRRRNSSGR